MAAPPSPFDHRASFCGFAFCERFEKNIIFRGDGPKSFHTLVCPHPHNDHEKVRHTAHEFQSYTWGLYAPHPPAAMHHLCGSAEPFRRQLCTIISGQTALSGGGGRIISLPLSRAAATRLRTSGYLSELYACMH